MSSETSSQKKAAKHLSIYAVGTVIRQLASFIMLPIYTTYLTPADYGAIALLGFMAALTELFLGIRMAQAVPKFYYEDKDPAYRRTVVSTTLIITSLASALASYSLYLLAPSISDILFGTGEYTLHVQIYSVVVLTSAIESYALMFFRLQEKPLLFMCLSLAKLITQLSLNIYFVVYLKMEALGVVYASIIAAAIFSLSTGLYVIGKTGLKINTLLLPRLLSFCWPLWLEGFAGLYIGSANRYFIRYFSDLTQVGLFELASKFAIILIVLVWDPFSQWWQTERFKLYNSPDKGKETFPSVFNGTLMILGLFALGLNLFSELVIQFVSSEAFSDSGKIIPILTLATFFTCLYNFFRFSFFATEKTIFATYINYAAAIVATVLYILLIPYYGSLGAALATLSTQFIVLTGGYYIAKNYAFDTNIRLGIFFRVTCLIILFSYIDAFISDLSTNLLIKFLTKIMLVLFYLYVCLRLCQHDPVLERLKNNMMTFLRGKTMFLKR